jgi:Ca2+-binding EF-hand superfamily protein
MNLEREQIKDHPFLTTLFRLVDRNNNGYVDFDELVGEIVFFMKASFKEKFDLYCEVLSMIDPEDIVPREKLQKRLDIAYVMYKEVLNSAKKLADAMNTKCDGKITEKEFQEFCEKFPQALDFLARLTIGPYPEPSQARPFTAHSESADSTGENNVMGQTQEPQPTKKQLAIKEEDRNKRWVPRT